MRKGVMIFIALVYAVWVLLYGAVEVGGTVVSSCNSAVRESKHAKEQEQKMADSYAEAIQHIQSGEYSKACSLLSRIEYYQNAKILLLYTRARIYYSRTEYEAYWTYKYLDAVPAEYAGDLSDEIAAFRTEAEERRADLKSLYDAEQKRQEQIKQELAEQQRKWLEEGRAEAAGHSQPYKGMNVEFIAYTQWGSYDSSERLSNGSRFYRWNKGSRNYYAIVKDGKVTDVGEIKPVTSSKKSTKSDDPYNASDYAHADDFYYDHMDDFWDYEDAEEYYETHQ